MKEITENFKKFHATYPFVFNIFNPLPSKDTENKCNVLLEFNNTVPAWKPILSTTFTAGNSILSGFKESNMSQKMLIKVRTFPANIIIHAGTNKPPLPHTPIHMNCFNKYKV